jgi:tetratricopeptide (TPR) repeat protein
MDTQTQFSNSQEPEVSTKASSSRKYMYIVAAIIIVIIVVLLVKNKGGNHTTTTSDGQNQIVTERVTNLSSQERQLLESQMAGYVEQLKKLDGDQFKEQRDGINYKLAGIEYKLGKYQDSLDTLNKISTESKQQAQIWALKTNIYRDMGDNAKALDAANNALKLDRESPKFWLAVIDLSTDKSNDEQKHQYEEALKLTQNDIDVVVSYAKFLEKIGDKPGAISFWQKAGQFDDKNKANYDAEIKRLQQ